MIRMAYRNKRIVDPGHGLVLYLSYFRGEIGALTTGYAPLAQGAIRDTATCMSPSPSTSAVRNKAKASLACWTIAIPLSVSRSIVAKCHMVQGAVRPPASNPRAAAVSDSIGMLPRLLLPSFDFRCQTCLAANNEQ